MRRVLPLQKIVVLADSGHTPAGVIDATGALRGRVRTHTAGQKGTLGIPPKLRGKQTLARNAPDHECRLKRGALI
jgi:hypothetical protein